MLRVNGLEKSFGHVRAVRNVSFSLKAGRITALLGQNGAGKTTTLKIILGFLRPDAGTAETDARRVGYVPDRPVFFPWLEGREVLELTRVSLGLAGRWWEDRVRELCGKLLFDPALLARKPVTYSAGNVKKLAFLQNLAVDPELLLVDEPFSALDPPSIKSARDLLLEARAKGASILLSSHLLAEMVRVSDDFIVIRSGGVVARSGLVEFATRSGTSAAEDVESAFLELMTG
jgi:ABC-2 type transport system ATP-binding protein